MNPQSLAAPVTAGAGLLNKLAQSIGALNSPLSGAINSIGSFGDAVVELGGAMGNVLKSGLQGLSAPLATAGKLFGSIGEGLKTAAAPLTGMVGALGGMVGAISGIGNAVGDFVKAANPAVFQAFSFATKDLMASIGIGLMPVMKFLTVVARALADVFFAVAQPIAKLMDAVLKPLGEIVTTLVNTFGPVLNIFGQLVGVVAEVVAPFAKLLASFVQIVALPIEIVFRVLAKVLEVLLIPLRLIAAVFNFVVDAIAGFIKRIRGLFGFKDTSGSSTGAAATNASLGSVESFQSKALTAAFMSGNEPKTERDLLERIIETLKNLPREIAEALKAVTKNSITDPDSIAKEAAKTGKSAGQIIEDRIEMAKNSPGRFAWMRTRERLGLD